jgi:hypothetical protein
MFHMRSNAANPTGLAATLMVIIVGLVVLDAAALTPMAAIPLPEPPAADLAMLPTVWGFP